jgi:glucose-6-phosphate 1-dehydrogenase
VLQNHSLQVVAHLIMDPPMGEECEAMRDRRANLLKAVRPIEPKDVVRGQYTGYRDVPGVQPGSTVESYIAVRLFVESGRWEGVPTHIRAGVTATEVSVEFRRPPRETFGEIVPIGSAHMRFRLGPDMAIGMGLRVKQPGERMAGNDTESIPTAQPARSGCLILLAMHGRATTTCSGREDIIIAEWRIVQHILDDATPPHTNVPGSWGSDEATRLIGGDGPWRDPHVTKRQAKIPSE